MLLTQCDFRTIKLATSVRQPQMSGVARQPVQDGVAHRIFAPTSTPTSAHVTSKRELSAVINSRRAAAVKSLSIVKVTQGLAVGLVSSDAVYEQDAVACVPTLPCVVL